MKLNKYLLLTAVILLVLIGTQTVHGQPPPPPPPPAGGPPCWPPPCVPVDGGLIFAIGAAVLFGGYALYKSIRSRVA